MADINGFDANQVKPNDEFVPIPAGEYDAIIIASDKKPTAKGDGAYIKLELQILSGEFQNRKVWDQLNIWNPNDKAVQIAKGTLSAICRAVGVMTPKDTAELHNKPLKIKVTVAKDPKYGEKNEVKAYKPRNGTTTTPPPSGGNPPAPVGAGAGKPW